MTTKTRPVLNDRPEDRVVLVRVNPLEARNVLNTATRQALAAF